MPAMVPKAVNRREDWQEERGKADDLRDDKPVAESKLIRCLANGILVHDG